MLESLDSESDGLWCEGCGRQGHLQDYCASQGGTYEGNRSAALNAQAAYLTQQRVEHDNKQYGWEPQASAVPSAAGTAVQQQLHVQTRVSQAFNHYRSDLDKMEDRYEREEGQQPSLGEDRVNVQHVMSRLGPPLNREVGNTHENQFKACIQQLDVHKDVDKGKLWRAGNQKAGEKRTGPGRESMHWKSTANKSAFKHKPRAARNKNMQGFTRVGTEESSAIKNGRSEISYV